MRPFLILITALLSAQLANAQSNQTRQTAQALVEGFSAWMTQNAISEGAIAISYQGKPIAEQGINRAPDDPAPIASLSKAITGICALNALNDAGKSHKLRLSEAMPSFFSKHRAKDRRLFAVTVGQLISQDSGIQSKFERRYKTFKTFTEAQKELQMRMIALERLGSNPGRSNHHYSNANYLALGLVIEDLTGETYEAYCKKTVLEPLGITNARLSTDWAVMSSFGGWEISAKDYLIFLNANFQDGLILGKTPTSFEPKVHMGKNRYYGPGVMFRKTDKGTLIWHAGAWKWSDKNIDAAFGAYFLMLDDGMAISLNFNDAALNGAFEDLEQRLWAITHP